MKTNGIVRKLDELGRLVIPIEIRKSLNINERDPLEIRVENDNIILNKKENTCAFCHTLYNLEQFKCNYICSDCKKKLIEGSL